MPVPQTTVGDRAIRRHVTLLAALVSSLLVFGLTPAAHAGPGEADFNSRIRSARSAAHLVGYVSRVDLVVVARRQAQRMAAQRRAFHNPDLTREVTGWRMVGENVGRGSSVAAIHHALMSSTSHRANILRRGFTEIGMGTATDARGVLYVVQVFRRPG